MPSPCYAITMVGAFLLHARIGDVQTSLDVFRSASDRSPPQRPLKGWFKATATPTCKTRFERTGLRTLEDCVQRYRVHTTSMRRFRVVDAKTKLFPQWIPAMPSKPKEHQWRTPKPIKDLKGTCHVQPPTIIEQNLKICAGSQCALETASSSVSFSCAGPSYAKGLPPNNQIATSCRGHLQCSDPEVLDSSYLLGVLLLVRLLFGAHGIRKG